MENVKSGDERRLAKRNLQRRKLLSLLSRKEKESLIDSEKLPHNFTNSYIEEYFIENWDEEVSDLIKEKIKNALGE